MNTSNFNVKTCARNSETLVTIVGLPAFDSNYLWLIHSHTHAWAVDPGDAQVIQGYLQRHALTLAGVLITHHHSDHVGGVLALQALYPKAPIIGPMTERIEGLTLDAQDGAHFELSGLNTLVAQCMTVPGHTAGHVAYFLPDVAGVPRVFCGDTLFAGGCGRLFEGTATQMLASLERLMALPAHTLAYCAHEYTASNLAFAAAVEPNNAPLKQRIADTAALRAQNQPTVPFALGLERLYNPFLRTAQADVIASASRHAGIDLTESVDVFAQLRAWKNVF